MWHLLFERWFWLLVVTVGPAQEFLGDTWAMFVMGSVCLLLDLPERLQAGGWKDYFRTSVGKWMVIVPVWLLGFGCLLVAAPKLLNPLELRLDRELIALRTRTDSGDDPLEIERLRDRIRRHAQAEDHEVHLRWTQQEGGDLLLVKTGKLFWAAKRELLEDLLQPDADPQRPLYCAVFVRRDLRFLTISGEEPLGVVRRDDLLPAFGSAPQSVHVPSAAALLAWTVLLRWAAGWLSRRRTDAGPPQETEQDAGVVPGPE